MIHRLRISILSLVTLAACAITASRPTQEFSDTSAALRAAKEVGADTLAPELYQQADEIFSRATREFRLKYFREAREHLLEARRFAEKAEFEALRAGATRVSTSPNDPLAEQNQKKEQFVPPKKEIYVESWDQQQQQVQQPKAPDSAPKK